MAEPPAPLAPAARRLLVAAGVRLHVARVLGSGPLPHDVDPDDVAAALAPVDDALERTHGLTFAPGYPGPAARRGAGRLVLACRAAHRGEPAAVVVTTLVPGREPLVTAAPPQTALHDG